MVIALSITDNKIDSFSSAKKFALYKIDYKKKIISKHIIVEADNCPGFAGKVFQLIDFETKVLITKEISGEEKTVLSNSNIEVQVGFYEDKETAINDFIKGL